MLEDSLDHGGEHLDDHHGPGPLSAVLGREGGLTQPGIPHSLRLPAGRDREPRSGARLIFKKPSFFTVVLGS